MKVFRPASVLLAALTIGACTAAPEDTTGTITMTDTAADEDAIEDLRTRWQQAFNAGDTATLVTLYTSDAVAMPDDQPAATGPQAIGQSVDAMRAMGTPQIELTSEETEVLGEWAFDRGRFTMTITPAGEGAQPMTEEGKYLVLLRRENDAWKVAREIGNSNAPMPPPSGMPGMEGATKKQ